MTKIVIGKKANQIEQQLNVVAQKWHRDFQELEGRIRAEVVRELMGASSGLLGKWELTIRDKFKSVQQTMLQDITSILGPGYQGVSMVDSAGVRLEYKGLSEANIQTLLGKIKLKRAYYYNRTEPKSYFPLDRLLGIEGSKWSPGMRRAMTLVGSECPFERAGDLLSELSGIVVSDDSIQRMTHRVGREIAERAQQERAQHQLEFLSQTQHAGRLYMEIDGGRVPLRLGWREVKLGCIFDGLKSAESERGAKKGPSRYFGGIYDELEEFICLWRQEAQAAGAAQVAELVMISDGAEWIWHRLAEEFPQARQILDYYHALEHASQVAIALFGEGTTASQEWLGHIGEKLKNGRVKEVTEELERLQRNNRRARFIIKDTIKYYQNNGHRMEYDRYLAAGYFIGSGVIESACQHLSNQRLKIAGARWNKDNAHNVLQIRIAWRNGTWNKYWESYRESA